MEKIDYIKEKLRNRKCHREVAFKCDVSERTLRNILKDGYSPLDKTVNDIFIYFKRKEK